MSELAIFPSVAPSAPVKDSQQLIMENRRSEPGENSFDKFFERAQQNQLKPESNREKPVESRQVKGESKRELERESERALKKSDSLPSKSTADSLENKVVDQEKTEASSESTSGDPVTEKVSVDVQVEKVQTSEEQSVVNQEIMLSLLAQLTEAESTTRTEIQPGVVQAIELTEAPGNSELAIQEISLSANAVPTTNLAGLNLATNTGSDELAVNQSGLEASQTLVAPNVQVKEGASVDGKTVDVSQLALTQTAEETVKAETQSQQGHGQGFGSKQEGNISFHQTSNPVNPLLDQNHAINGTVLSGNDLAQETATESATPKEQVLVHDELAVAKIGKVNLALIQTQLAVSEAPEPKSDIPVLNIMPQPVSTGNTPSVQTAASAGVNPLNKEELFAQIVEHAKVVVTNGGSEMEVNLKPEHLGKLQLKVTIENQVVTARFVAESQQVKEIIESNLNQLRRNLQESGMQVDSIMVSVGNHQSNEGFEQAAYNQGSHSQHQGTTGTFSDESSPENELSELPVERETVVDLIA